MTQEEIRAEATLKLAAESLGYDLHAWSAVDGMLDVCTGSSDPLTDPVQAASALSDLPEKTILLLRDFHAYLGDASLPADPLLVRTLKEQVRRARCSSRALVILGCRLVLPPELEKEFTVLHTALPDRTELRTLAAAIAESGGVNPGPEALERAAEAARGLTTQEAEDVMALSIVRRQPLDPVLIASEKARAVKKAGLLEFVESERSLQDIGGLDGLKTWLQRRRCAFTPEAEAFGLPSPRGILLAGIPGTGKSLTAKAAAQILGKPRLRLDAGRLFAGIVGESEANLRRVLATAEAASPCILWIDEIEKGMGGSGSNGTTDGGTGARVFGSFLSWMQEKTSPVFVIATANDIGRLPPELLRKGRFDELFFLDLPREAEREAIWRIHIAKRGRDPETFAPKTLGRHSEGFTGSEIEQAFIDALFTAYDAGREVSPEDVTESLRRTVPLSVTMSEDIQALRKWASKRARSASGDAGEGSTARRIAA